MKIIKIFCILCYSYLIMSCSNNDESPVTPSDISNITAEAREGAIMLRWDVPADSNYFYVKTIYNDPISGEMVTKTSSIFSDSILISGLYNKHGDYTFQLQPFSNTNTGGAVHPIQKTCEKVKPTFSIAEEQPISLALENMSTNAQESSEGPIANLIDGNNETFFHSQWSNSPPPFPHWITVDLKDDIEAFKFQYYTRHNNGNGAPRDMDVMISNDNVNWTTLANLTTANDRLPTDKAASYNSKFYILTPNTTKYIRFSVKNTASVNSFALAELKITKGVVTVYDPENE